MRQDGFGCWARRPVRCAGKKRKPSSRTLLGGAKDRKNDSSKERRFEGTQVRRFEGTKVRRGARRRVRRVRRRHHRHASGMNRNLHVGKVGSRDFSRGPSPLALDGLGTLGIGPSGLRSGLLDVARGLRCANALGVLRADGHAFGRRRASWRILK
jgi:hypothetical protein